MIQLSGPGLFQWDTGRMVELTDSTATHVHFANPGDALAPILPASSGKVKIPDYLLQTGKTLLVYAVANGITLEQRSFFVTKRERPENYVYEDDQRNYIYTLIQNAEAAAQAAEAVAKDLRDAKDRGEFNGPPGADPTEEQIQAAVEQYFEEHPASGGGGFSPVITVQPIDGGSRIFITDITGTKSVDVLNGTDGFSPSVGVTQIPGGYQLDIHNRDSFKIVQIMNGTDGDDGEPGKSAYQYAKDGGYTGTEAQFAAKLAAEYPTKVSQLTNDSGFITASGAPVQSVNGKAGAVKLSAGDVGARPSTWTPSYTDVGADKSGAATSAVSGHNTSDEAHNDIRLLITGLAARLDALANSDDDTLDQMAEVVAYIKANRDLIDQITTGKVSVSDIVNNLTTNVSNKPLSAAQGVALKKLIDAITVPTKVSQLTNDSGFITDYTETDPTVPAWAKASTKPSYSKSEVGLGNVDNLKQYSASNPPPYPVTSVNGNTGAVTLDAEAVGARPSTWTPTAANVGAVPTSRTVNGKKLSANITLAASDVGAVPTSDAITVTGVDADGNTHTWTMYGVKN